MGKEIKRLKIENTASKNFFKKFSKKYLHTTLVVVLYTHKEQEIKNHLGGTKI